MKFAHMADVHIGSWRDPRLSNVSTEAFLKATQLCYEEKVDFIIISGDFFNTSLPSIDCLKQVVLSLRQTRDKGINVYAIAGSHDFSPTGKTMLDVLENAGLLKNVMRGKVKDNTLHLNFTLDEKTGAKITGIIGKKGMLEKNYFENLNTTNLEMEEGFKIFMFHTAISEFKPKGLEKMDSTPLSTFPKGFSYYAGGHVHEPYVKEYPGYGTIGNTGPLFPNNFREIEKLSCGGFYIVSANNGKITPKFERIIIHNVQSLFIDCNQKTIEEVNDLLLSEINGKEFNNTIVTIRLEGRLKSGKPSDIEFKKISELLYEKSAHFVMKNTAALTSPEFEEVKLSTQSVAQTQETIIKEHLSQFKVIGLDKESEYDLVKNLMETLRAEKNEGETISTFEKRITDDIQKILSI